MIKKVEIEYTKRNKDLKNELICNDITVGDMINLLNRFDKNTKLHQETSHMEQGRIIKPLFRLHVQEMNCKTVTIQCRDAFDYTDYETDVVVLDNKGSEKVLIIDILTV